jgi:hypothetical protein
VVAPSLIFNKKIPEKEIFIKGYVKPINNLVD